MTTHRDVVRAQRSKVFRTAQGAGINLDEERHQEGIDQRKLAFQAKKIINDLVPRTDREQLRVDNPPPGGAFDGANTAFTLSAPVIGENVTVLWMNTDGQQLVTCARTNDNPPPAQSFFFDPSNPTAIVVGSAPKSNDGLAVVYRIV